MKRILKKILPEFVILFLYHFPVAVLSAIFYGFPAKKIIIIGVAGTKGKSTTSYLISQILEKTGKKVALISTALVKIDKKEELNNVKFTTPPPFFLQRFIRKAVQADCQYLILETSSHALIQRRSFGIPFHIIVLTNMMPDHLDYHKTAENYSNSHKRMISSCSTYLVFNNDEPNLEKLLENLSFPGEKINYSTKKSADITASEIVFHNQETTFTVKAASESIKMSLPLLGEFNTYNALAAISVAFTQGIDLVTISEIVKTLKSAPGRLERIIEGQDFEVIVDYAHSPDSLNSFFNSIKTGVDKRIITVFGACGDRDRSVRPAMGEIVDKNSDYLVITNDDPYQEDPEQIVSDLWKGIKNKKIDENLWKILDRKTAIEKAISLAKKGDLVLVLGKGSEQFQVFKDKKMPWDDRIVVRDVLKNRN